MAPKKGQLAKSQTIFSQGWEWVQELEGQVQVESITEANLWSSYLVNAAVCEESTCRTNCKRNPNCLNKIGEKFWFGEIKDNFWVEFEDPQEQKKEEESHVGLKNLGATCYVNTFLQLWFHNPAFRSAIFQWVPVEGYTVPSLEDTKTVMKCCDNDIEDEESQAKTLELTNNLPTLKTLPLPKFGQSVSDNINGNLQLLFGLMKYSMKRFVDPTPFVESLGLQTNEQQDAQEFSKLFMCLLEEALSNQKSNVKSLVQDQFGGKYAYVTRCSKCGRSSERESCFYELDLNIQGHSQLTECIKEFLKEEKLDGDNKYFCANCQQKQDASRRIVLQTLPPVLNLQLLRFVFDRNTGSKRKCNSVLKFPDCLDMNNFTKLDEPAHGIYELTAVLIHVGMTASSGHYVAHILDKKDGTWYRFNDEAVEKMKGKKLQLGAEDDPEENPSKTTKKPRASKGMHSSKNAYMLVYTRKSELDENAFETSPPEPIIEHVVKDNSLLDAWINEVNVIVEGKIQSGKKRQEELKEVFNKLKPNKGEESEWLSAEWLRLLFNEKVTVVPPIDNSPLMCKHARFDPGKLKLSKRISTEAGDILFKNYGGSKRLKIDGFWVGKESLKKWRQLAIDEQNFIENSEGRYSPISPAETQKEDPCMNGSINDTPNSNSLDIQTEADCNIPAMPQCKRKLIDDQASIDAKLPRIDNEKSLSSLEEQISNGHDNKIMVNGSETDANQWRIKQFNQDIICSEHGKLCLEESKRRIVSQEVWDRLMYYFRNCPEFKSKEPSCLACQNQSVKKKEKRQAFKAIASDMKNVLSNLYADVKRPQLDISEFFQVYIVSTRTLDEWRYFIKHAKEPQYSLIENEDLICQHGKLIYSTDDFLLRETDKEFTLVYQEEWGLLSSFAACDKELSIMNIPASGEENSSNVITITPECCEDCRSARLNQVHEAGKQFLYATIYVRKITGEDAEKECLSVNSEEDTNCKKLTNSSKKKLSEPSKGSRQSSRHRIQRGEYAFRVDSTQTLKDMKIQLLSTFSVLPIDQHLSFENGESIEGDMMTLGDLGIRPGCYLLLRADEALENGPVEEEIRVDGERKLEEGFKGTGLMSFGTPPTEINTDKTNPHVSQ
eukprot:gene15135-16691_t